MILCNLMRASNPNGHSAHDLLLVLAKVTSD